MATLVHGFFMDIFETTIRRFLDGHGHTWTLNTTKFDYRWDIVRSGEFQRNEEKRTVSHWLAKYIATNEERAKWVTTPGLRVLERPAPTTDLSSLWKELDNLWVDLDAILAPPTDHPEFAPPALADDTVLDALFGEDMTRPEPTRSEGKRPRSNHTSDATKDALIKKTECHMREKAMRASIVDEDLRQ
uniref:Integrase core domain containing protein n=1 Tax=Solanum tuberosum TaxID=4113 RepID=M1DJH9_SOLTU